MLGGARSEAEIIALLERLRGQELVELRPVSRFAGQHEVVFHHALVRDAAYSMLTDDDRVAGHRVAAEWLEARGETDSMVLAGHFEHGVEGVRAAPYWLRAASASLEANDLDQALTLAERGITCLAGQATVRSDIRGRLSLVQAQGHRWRGQLPDAKRAAQAALDELAPASAEALEAAEILILLSAKLGGDGLDELIERILRTKPDRPAMVAYISVLCRIGTTFLFRGEHDRSMQPLAEAMRLAKELPVCAPTTTVFIHHALALSAGVVGKWEEAARSFEMAVSNADRIGDIRVAAGMRVNLGDAYRNLGEYERAERLAREAIETAITLGLDHVRPLRRHQPYRCAVGASQLARTASMLRKRPRFSSAKVIT